MMIRSRSGLLALVLLLGAVAPAYGKALELRSGEHATFSRLVLDLPAGATWSLGRTSEGYELRLDGVGDEIDISGVFGRIPKTRLSAVSIAESGAAVALTVQPGAHATATQNDSGRLIIDIADGPAAPESAFEKPLPEVAAKPEKAGSEAAASGTSGPATLSFRLDQNRDASLPIYWNTLKTEPAATPRQKDDLVTLAEAAPPVLPVVIEPPAPEAPPLPGPDVMSVEEELRRQLSRAAAQGLAELPEAPATASPQNAPAADEAPPATEETAQQSDAAVAFHAETSMDRDGRDNPNEERVTSDGATCLIDDALALRDWGGEGAPADQLSAARNGLVGEFDRADSEAVRRLARLYLHFGLGAEARQTIKGFGLVAEDTELLLDLANVMDATAVPPESPLLGMGDCDSAAALWSVLAAPDDPPLYKINLPAVLRAFSGLPPGLRQHLGRRLSDRLIAMGSLDGAKAVRNAVARPATPENRELGLIDAEISVSEAPSTEALGKLDALLGSNDDVALRALVLSVQTKLAQDAPVDPRQVEAIAALAFEYRYAENGAAFAELEIAALAASGQFDQAFARFSEEQANRADWNAAGSREALFTRLAATGDDGVFLKSYYANKELTQGLGMAPRVALGARLLTLGFPDETRTILNGGETAARPEAQELLAQAALALGDADLALSLAETADTNAAKAVRAGALAARGDFGEAARAYNAAGLEEQAASAAWSAGDLTLAASLSPERAKMAAALTGPVSQQEGAPNLAAGRQALSDSADFRAALAQLLAPSQTGSQGAGPAATGN